MRIWYCYNANVVSPGMSTLLLVLYLILEEQYFLLTNSQYLTERLSSLYTASFLENWKSCEDEPFPPIQGHLLKLKGRDQDIYIQNPESPKWLETSEAGLVGISMARHNTCLDIYSHMKPQQYIHSETL